MWDARMLESEDQGDHGKQECYEIVVDLMQIPSSAILTEAVVSSACRLPASFLFFTVWFASLVPVVSKFNTYLPDDYVDVPEPTRLPCIKIEYRSTIPRFPTRSICHYGVRV